MSRIDIADCGWTLPTRGLMAAYKYLQYPAWLFAGTGLLYENGQVPSDISLPDFLRVVDNLRQNLSDPKVHFSLARQRPNFDLIHELQHCPDLCEGLRFYARYWNHSYPFAQLFVQVSPTDVRLNCVPLIDHPAIPFMIENGLMNMIYLFALVPGLRLDEATLAFGQPSMFDPLIYAAKLGCKVEFGAPWTALILPHRLALQRHWDYDPVAWKLALERSELHFSKGRHSDFILQLKVTIEEHQAANDRSPSLACMARHFGIGPRSLHRILAAQGTCFRDLTRDLKWQRAKYLLAQSDVNIGEVASKLGFADQSSFSRSFKRQIGMSPSEFRKGIAS